MKRLLFLLTFSLCIPILLNAGALEDLAASGDKAYREGDYETAIGHYTQAIEGGYTGGNLLYNLGNSYFKQGELGLAILFFERAKRELPHDRDVRYNLALANSKTIDDIQPAPRLPLWDWLDFIRDMFSPGLLSWLCLGLAVAVSLLVSGWLLVKSRSLAKVLQVSWIVTASIFVLFSSLLTLRVVQDRQPPGAIIMVDKVVVRSAPDPGSSEVFHLHEGTRVDVLKELEGFREIALEDGRQGWLPWSSCENI